MMKYTPNGSYRHMSQYVVKLAIKKRRNLTLVMKMGPLLANWVADEAKSKSQSAAGSRTSALPEKKMHKHDEGPQTLTNIEWLMSFWSNQLHILIL
ncbi:unnamed protein product [Brassica oleracea var. botrytis]